MLPDSMMRNDCINMPVDKAVVHSQKEQQQRLLCTEAMLLCETHRRKIKDTFKLCNCSLFVS